MNDLGAPRLHLRQTDSTNVRARELAAAGAPHGALVTASEQLAGRGRQGRQWSSPPGRSLAMSLILRDPPRLLSMAAGVAVAETVDAVSAQAAPSEIKWPNDILVRGRKVAGILVEGRPLDGWAVLGIGINVAVPEREFPPELQGQAGTLGLEPSAIEPTLTRLLEELDHWTAASEEAVLDAVRSRDALLGRQVAWAHGAGVAAGIDPAGRLLVAVDGETDAPLALDAGEVHLSSVS